MQYISQSLKLLDAHDIIMYDIDGSIASCYHYSYTCMIPIPLSHAAFMLGKLGWSQYAQMKLVLYTAIEIQSCMPICIEQSNIIIIDSAEPLF